MSQPDLLSRPDENTFYDAYPRKVGKKCSHKAYKSAIKEISSEALQKAVEAFAAITDEQTKYKSLKGKDKQEALKYITHPATWLNQGRWEDEVIEEYLARPEVPDLVIVKRGHPGFDDWITRKIAEGGARSFWQKQDIIAVPTPLPGDDQ